MQKGILIGLALTLLAGCIGDGDGWVISELWMGHCSDGNPLGAPDAPERVDLEVDFFSAEPQDDGNPSEELRRNSLTVRLQNTSNNVESTNGLMIQLLDMGKVAEAFVQGELLPISANNLCEGGNCALMEDLVRSSLYLYTSCPANSAPLVGSNFTLSTSADDPGCLISGGEVAACPALSDSQQQELDAICEADFNDRSHYDAIGSLLGNGACLYFCHLGSAQRGDDPATMDGFRIEYGNTVAGIFSMGVVDGRAINLQSCAQVQGSARGMFSFEVTRGRAAQAFP